MSALETITKPVTQSRVFLEECWAEVRKVHWPARKETQGATFVVVLAVLLVSVYLGLTDFVLTWLIHQAGALP